MLTFNLKKQWFDKIKSGGKTHEYREVKPYWADKLTGVEVPLCLIRVDYCHFIYGYDKRFETFDIEQCNFYCFFACGYPKRDEKDKWLKAKIKKISIINGKNTDLAIDKDVYDIEFELIRK